MLDWMDALGGVKLVDHTFRVFSKELETESLADLRQRISDNLPSLTSEAEAEINRAFVPPKPPFRSGQFNNKPFGQRKSPPPQQFQPFQSARPSPQPRPPPPQQNPSLLPPCKLCATTKPDVAHTHGIGTCFQLYGTKKRQVTRAVHTDDTEEATQPEYTSYEYDIEYESDEYDTGEAATFVEVED